MKYIILLILSEFFLIPAQAQKKADSVEQASMIKRIETTTDTINTLQCQFQQIKHISLLNEDMVSKGLMYLSNNGQLRWEYTSPYTYTFIYNGSKVLLKSTQKTDVIDVQSSRLFQEIGRIMMNSVTGQCLSSQEDFNVTMFLGTDGQEWIAQLVPLKKQMKQMFQTISLHISSEKGFVSMVEMTERTGDRTIIQLTNTKINAPIDEKIFMLN